MGQSFELLSPQKRAEHYRDLADAAFLKAQRAQDTGEWAEYLSMAAGWHVLATEIEKEQDSLAVPAPAESGQDETQSAH